MQGVSWCILLHMAATTTATRAESALTYDLPASTWGDLFGRIRKKHYRNGTVLAAELGNYGVETTASTISRLESLDQAPTAASQRIIAAVILVLCDIHPERLGIRLDELPLSVYGNLFGAPDDPSGLGVTPRACNGKKLPPRARAAKASAIAA